MALAQAEDAADLTEVGRAAMQLTDGRNTELPYIDSYRAGGFTVRGVFHTGSIFVSRAGVMPWAEASVAGATADTFAPLLAAAPEMETLILGCGRGAMRLAPSLRAALKARGIVVEAMDTGAACRTFNLMSMERRRVGAALIAL